MREIGTDERIFYDENGYAWLNSINIPILNK